MEREALILIAYDGSEPARAAVRAAGDLFPGATALVLTVWEPELAQVLLMPDSTGMGGTMLPYDPAVVHEVEHASEQHALEVAQDGVRVAHDAGLRAQAIVAEKNLEPQDAIVTAAEQHAARAIVIGSRGLRGLKSKLLGSTSAHVLQHALCPVVVVRHPEDRHAQA
jgi:nucleotide-binding universal stress UspA family protein